MEIIRIPRIMQDTSMGHLLHSRTIGFVPTMGALHQGHMSLVRMAREENNITAVSIFVNPAQFGPAEDLTVYPRPIEADIEKLRNEGVDILFLPDDSLIYPDGFSTFVETGVLTERMCGSFRPGHFRGVATVVAKLFNITRPTRAYFGQKDFQQTVVIKRLVKDLNFGLEVVVCPTVREEDGLAMSSRNAYLGREERSAATVLWKTLNEAEAAIKSGISSGTRIKDIMNSRLKQDPLLTSVDYASAFDPKTLDEVEELKGDLLLAIAARMGKTRLIDNIIVTV
jgi:pantoate--beta-alanine ligase